MSSKYPHLAHPKYRPDIDGLRAVAIIAVVMFHAFPGNMPGGFIGVDIFFVISGYLISTIIFSSLERDRFSLAEFYIRRVRRIFPALLLVLASCMTFGWFVLIDVEYTQLGKHVVGGAGFVENLVLLREAGYFDVASETKPLLHLWSLAIEEQFYIFWPLLLGFVWKRNWNFFRLTAAIAAISLAASFFMLNADPSKAFYHPLSRFWELMVGGMLAYAVLHRPSIIRINGNAQSTAGFILIAAGLLLLDEEKAFPGFWALLPVFGAFLVISAGEDAWLNKRILSCRPMIWVGLVSYPLYLWHWPLLAFARILEGETPNQAIRLAAIVSSLFLAWMTYKVVEQPLRSGRNGRAKAVILMALMVAMLVAGYGAHKSWIRPGLHQDMPTFAAEEGARNRWICGEIAADHCRNDNRTTPTAVVIGDSHAVRLYPSLRRMFSERGIALALLAQNGCPPFMGLTRNEEGCYRQVNALLQSIISDPAIKQVVITNRGPLHSSGTGFGAGENGLKVILGLHGSVTRLSNKEVISVSLDSTLARLRQAGKDVIYLHDVPELDFDPHKCIARPFRLSGENFVCAIPNSKFVERYKDYRDVVTPILGSYSNVRTIDLSGAICGDKLCYASIDGQLLYDDSHHLSEYGADYVLHKLEPLFFAPGDFNRVSSAQ